ncbi:hypothetical protein C882_2905 [Caenispirillum salinarum AK4]|uniref:Autotransporter domain-containing protein n=1 Tax=Caenispirillum salinarum AK4 TaxID=1238182 RepID=K9GM78_9PROT|nr:hypothetical protein [Caenispirillum salinarum]EKV26137.1 hypothetical protein C882_2905 [Caenispirillum salinarum AK4]
MRLSAFRRLSVLLAAAVLLPVAPAPARALTPGTEAPAPVAQPEASPETAELAPLASVRPYHGHVPRRRDLGLRGSWRARASLGGSEDNRTTAVELPLSLTYGFGDGAEISLDAPLRLRDRAQGVGGYSGDLRLAAGLPITEQWTLRPSVRVGVSGPLAPGTGRRTVSGRVVSSVAWPVTPGLRLTLGTTGEAFDSARLGKRGDGVVDFTLRNRLGLTLDTGVDVFGGDLDATAAFTDMRRLDAGGLTRRDRIDLGLSGGGRLKLGASASLAREAETAEAGIRARLFTRF